MREEEGAPKPDLRSAGRTADEAKVDSGVVDLVDVIEILVKRIAVILNYHDQLVDTIVKFITASEMIVKRKLLRSMRPSIYSPPGGLAKSIILFVFPKKVFDKIFAQAINDMREKHAEALASAFLWKARWIVFRDHLTLCLTVVAYLSAAVMKKAAGIWKMIP